MPLANNYYKIGLFFFIGLALFIGGLITFGLLGSISSDAIKCETFFASSVQGLSKSSSVKFRGFEVGKVESISLAPISSEGSQPMVKVSFHIDVKALTDGLEASPEEARAYVIEQVNYGLRAILSFQGITGISFIDLDYRGNAIYLPPEIQKRITASLDNGMVYVPSGPGQIMEISESASRIVKSLSAIDFSAFATDLKRLVDSVNKAVGDLQTDQISTDMQKTMQEVSVAANKLGKLAEGLDKSLIGDDAGRGELEATLRQLRKTLKRTEQLLAEGQNSLPQSMENLRVISDNLRDLSDDAKEYPSRLIFGQPPEHTRPGKKRR